MRFITAVPLFLYLLLFANLAMWAGDGQQSMLNEIVLEFKLPSTRLMILTISDVFILLSFVFLFIETFKATRTSNMVIVDHALSMGVFVICLVEFLIFPRLGNTTFLVICVASFLDVITGFTVSLSTARRDISFGG